MPKVMIVDDHEVVLKGFAAIIADKPSWQLVGATTRAAEALDIVARENPDIAVIDYSLGDIDGVELTRRALAINPDLQVLIFTMHYSEVVIRDSLTAGARGFVLKSDVGQMLDAGLEAMAAGEAFLPGLAGDLVLRSYLGRDGDSNGSLTPREREVMKLIALGNSGKEVALKLQISPKTVEIHRAAVLRKLNLRNMVDLVRYAVRNGLIEP